MKPEFEARMKDLLKEEYPAFEQAMKESPRRGYRINPLKTSAEEFFRLTGYPEYPTPFAQYAYYLPEQSGAGATAVHAAGLLYLQEPSAASAVSVLDPKPGMKVLDLCAAPGSKTTEIAGLMHNQGLLAANEINPGRSKILVENVERWGAENVMVLNADPAEVAESFPEYFDAVLCDAPCSGEGMFRKNPDAEKEWSPESVLSCAKRQRTILSSALNCLKPGGRLVYSTCTFSLEENEENVSWLLSEYPFMKLEPIQASFGRPGFELGSGTSMCRRIFPMDGGEGHFIASFRKETDAQASYCSALLKSEPMPRAAEDFLKQISYPYTYVHHNKVYGGTFPFVSPGTCRLLRHQVLLGEVKKDRFEPDHALFLSSDHPFPVKMELQDSEVRPYLSGMTIPCTGKGYTAVCWHGHALGFGKADGAILKNRYPKELRLK